MRSTEQHGFRATLDGLAARAAAVAEEAGRQYASLLRERDALRRRVELGDAAPETDLMEVERAGEARRLAADSTRDSARRAMAIASSVAAARASRHAAGTGRPAGRGGLDRAHRRPKHENRALAKGAEQQEAVAARARADRATQHRLRVLGDRGGAEGVIAWCFPCPSVGAGVRWARPRPPRPVHGTMTPP